MAGSNTKSKQLEKEEKPRTVQQVATRKPRFNSALFIGVFLLLAVGVDYLFKWKSTSRSVYPLNNQSLTILSTGIFSTTVCDTGSG